MMNMKISPIILMLLLTNFDFSDMNIKDDAFHDELAFHIETWYFEIISKNESMVFMITLIGKMMAMIGVQFYENGIPLYDGRKIYSSFNTSNEIPYIAINGKEIMKGCVKNGKLFYKISYSSENISLNLFFQNRSKGWKNKKWLAIPNMKANGSISFQGKEFKMNGKGYHDHNIFYIWQPFVERGYIDGKVILGNISLFWARLMRNAFIHEDFAIYSNSSYHVLNVAIKCRKYRLNNGHLIPTSFEIQGEGINLTINATAIHFISLPFIKYWRYHVHSKGMIKGEKIESFDIVEYMLFKPF